MKIVNETELLALERKLSEAQSVVSKTGGDRSAYIKAVLSAPNIAPLMGGPPNEVPTAKICPGFDAACGVYLLLSPTGGGKTVSAMGLVSCANHLKTPAVYYNVFEPRAPLYGSSFDNPVEFINDATALFPDQTDPKAKVRLVVFDSITLPLKTWAVTRVGQPTFPGGMQPSDRDFLDKLSKLALRAKLVIIVTVNTGLVPYVSDLAGGCEGMIVIKKPGMFTYVDRTNSSRRATSSLIEIPSKIMHGVFKILGWVEEN